ncbi:MerR family transcriptional regulator [Rhizobium wuzhouense]|uniref:MerR family transcriptional regulator n=1 Tax=Rhizobium wuzhouense TaxID=1986026 RepID=A0ABX5NXS6_9HYPH|nr:cobalamin B12-binding domain-containing protein [Rhizobium wuzhouense]PYB77088.1 hypothetical protein DMY87_01505 [Rhizobium wuzhouense]
MHSGQGGENCGQALLSLAEVLSISGITKLVLHAWERRYGIEPTQRSGTGRRFYTAEQAERLRLLKVCSDAGHRIGNLITLPLDELQRIETTQIERERNAPLIAAIRAMDGEAFRNLLLARAESEGPDVFLDTTALPLLRDIGNLWSEDELSIAAEHLATATLKRLLGTMFDTSPRPGADAPRLITATLSGEEHEIGALAAAWIARLHGWDSLCLGPNLPPEEVAAAAETRQARMVCISAVHGKPARLEAGLRQLRGALPRTIRLVTGGPAYAAMPALDGVSYLPHFDAFRQMVEAER